MKITFAHILLQWRTARGLTQAHAAAEMQISPRTYEAYEQGRYEPRSALLRETLLNKIQTSGPKGKP